MSAKPINEVLQERGSRYGDFATHAEVTQDLQNVLARHLQQRGKTLAPYQTEALEMICHKIGRIINGDPNYDDSWVDIAGYAQLVVDELRKGGAAPSPSVWMPKLGDKVRLMGGSNVAWEVINLPSSEESRYALRMVGSLWRVYASHVEMEPA